MMEAICTIDELPRLLQQQDRNALLDLIKRCGKDKDLVSARRIHGELLHRKLFVHDIYVNNALLSLYSKCGALSAAQHVFDKLPSRNIVSWNALISAYVHHGHGDKAIICFKKMKDQGFSPNEVTFTSILKGCGDFRDIKEGKQIHNMIVIRGWLEENVELGNALVDMYAKCGALAEAYEVLLKELHDRDLITWSSLIARYVEQGQTLEALKCFEQMQGERFSPNEFTLTCVLDACSGREDIEKGRQIHDAIVQRGSLERRNIVLGSAVIKMYAKCGELSEAQKVLDGLPFRDLVMWKSVVIPNVRLREDDVHLFEMNQIKYIRRDMEDNYIDIRRRAACEIVKGLSLIIVLKLMVCFQRMCKA